MEILDTSIFVIAIFIPEPKSCILIYRQEDHSAENNQHNHFTVVLTCMADVFKLKPMVIFK